MPSLLRRLHEPSLLVASFFFFFYVSFISTGSFSLINLSIRQRWHQSRSHPFFFFLDEMKRFSLCQDFGFFIRRRLHRVIISGDGIWPKWNVDWNRWISRGNANSRNYAYASGADDFITARNRSKGYEWYWSHVGCNFTNRLSCNLLIVKLFLWINVPTTGWWRWRLWRHWPVYTLRS